MINPVILTLWVPSQNEDFYLKIEIAEAEGTLVYTFWQATAENKAWSELIISENQRWSGYDKGIKQKVFFYFDIQSQVLYHCTSSKGYPDRYDIYQLVGNRIARQRILPKAVKEDKLAEKIKPEFIPDTPNTPFEENEISTGILNNDRLKIEAFDLEALMCNIEFKKTLDYSYELLTLGQRKTIYQVVSTVWEELCNKAVNDEEYKRALHCALTGGFPDETISITTKSHILVLRAHLRLDFAGDLDKQFYLEKTITETDLYCFLVDCLVQELKRLGEENIESFIRISDERKPLARDKKVNFDPNLTYEEHAFLDLLLGWNPRIQAQKFLFIFEKTRLYVQLYENQKPITDSALFKIGETYTARREWHENIAAETAKDFYKFCKGLIDAFSELVDMPDLHLNEDEIAFLNFLLDFNQFNGRHIRISNAEQFAFIYTKAYQYIHEKQNHNDAFWRLTQAFLTLQLWKKDISKNRCLPITSGKMPQEYAEKTLATLQKVCGNIVYDLNSSKMFDIMVIRFEKLVTDYFQFFCLLFLKEPIFKTIATPAIASHYKDLPQEHYRNLLDLIKYSYYYEDPLEEMIVHIRIYSGMTYVIKKYSYLKKLYEENNLSMDDPVFFTLAAFLYWDKNIQAMINKNENIYDVQEIVNQLNLLTNKVLGKFFNELEKIIDQPKLYLNPNNAHYHKAMAHREFFLTLKLDYCDELKLRDLILEMIDEINESDNLSEKLAEKLYNQATKQIAFISTQIASTDPDWQNVWNAAIKTGSVKLLSLLLDFNDFRKILHPSYDVYSLLSFSIFNQKNTSIHDFFIENIGINENDLMSFCMKNINSENNAFQINDDMVYQLFEFMCALQVNAKNRYLCTFLLKRFGLLKDKNNNTVLHIASNPKKTNATVIKTFLEFFPEHFYEMVNMENEHGEIPFFDVINAFLPQNKDNQATLKKILEGLKTVYLREHGEKNVLSYLLQYSDFAHLLLPQTDNDKIIEGVLCPAKHLLLFLGVYFESSRYNDNALDHVYWSQAIARNLSRNERITAMSYIQFHQRLINCFATSMQPIFSNALIEMQIFFNEKKWLLNLDIGYSESEPEKTYKLHYYYCRTFQNLIEEIASINPHRLESLLEDNYAPLFSKKIVFQFIKTCFDNHQAEASELFILKLQYIKALLQKACMTKNFKVAENLMEAYRGLCFDEIKTISHDSIRTEKILSEMNDMVNSVRNFLPFIIPNLSPQCTYALLYHSKDSSLPTPRIDIGADLNNQAINHMGIFYVHACLLLRAKLPDKYGIYKKDYNQFVNLMNKENLKQQDISDLLTKNPENSFWQVFKNKNIDEIQTNIVQYNQYLIYGKRANGESLFLTAKELESEDDFIVSYRAQVENHNKLCCVQ